MISGNIADDCDAAHGPGMEPPSTSSTIRGRAVDVAGLQGSFPMPYDRPEWSRSIP